MRDIWLEEVAKAASIDPSIVLISADLGYGVFESFESHFPKQFLNCGVAEQNMAGIAAGMALVGRKVFCYSIGNFSTIRCLEQIRNDVCYHNLDVCFVAVGAGFGYGALGMSHHLTEDLPIMRSIPRLRTYIPHSNETCRQIVRRILNSSGPTYLRLERGSGGVPENAITDYENPTSFDPADILVVASGGIVHEAIRLQQMLNQFSKPATVTSIQSFEDIDLPRLRLGVEKARYVLTLEEGVRTGGLGSFIAEIASEGDSRPKVFRFGLSSQFVSLVGDQTYLRGETGLSAEKIFEQLKGYIL